MKRILLVLLLVGLSIGMYLGFSQFGSQTHSETNYYSENYFTPPGIKGSENVKLVRSCLFPETPSEIPSLRITDQNLTPDRVREVAEKMFGLSGEVEEYEGDMSIQTGSRMLEMFSTGGLMYTDFSEQPIENLSNEEAREVAENFLNKAKIHGLTPQNPGVRITFQGIGPGSTGVLDTPTENGWKESKEEVYTISVDYAIRFRNFAMRGPGADVTVDVGENGELKAFQGNWTKFEVDDNIPVVTAKKAFGRLINGTAVNSPRSLGMEKVVVENIGLGYYCPAPGVSQENLTPAYMFQSTLIYGGGEGSGWTFAVPASVELE